MAPRLSLFMSAVIMLVTNVGQFYSLSVGCFWVLQLEVLPNPLLKRAHLSARLAEGKKRDGFWRDVQKVHILSE